MGTERGYQGDNNREILTKTVPGRINIWLAQPAPALPGITEVD